MKARITDAVAGYGNKACFKPRGTGPVSSGYVIPSEVLAFEID
jgi:hypothetical protein